MQGRRLRTVPLRGLAPGHGQYESEQMRYLLQVHYAQRIITQKYPPYLNKFQFDAALLAQATPRQRRLLGDHVPSNYD